MSSTNAVAAPPSPPVDVDVVVPVFDEERSLRPCVERLTAYLDERFPFSWRVTVVDNASTDATWGIACSLAEADDRVRAIHLDEKGRGRALRAAWAESDAAVVAYMDVDLSTGLDALLPLVAPLLSGHSDVAIGSRLSRGSRVVRGPRREVVSRTYNRILKVLLGAGFHDAQCGFKAARASTARALLPAVKDEGWFFDTELLVLAERSGMRIAEVPVDWVDDPDSRVDVVRTAIDDLRGVWRLSTGFWFGRADVVVDAVAVGATSPPRHAASGGELVSFATVGTACTGLYLGSYSLLRRRLGPRSANLVALTATALVNTSANRRATFSAPRPHHRARELARAGAVHAAGLAITSAGLTALERTRPLDARSARPDEMIVVLAASAVATGLRFLLMPVWIFREHAR